MADAMLWHGFDYAGIAVVIQMKGFSGKKAVEIFEGLQTMELAALPILNKPKKK